MKIQTFIVMVTALILPCIAVADFPVRPGVLCRVKNAPCDVSFYDKDGHDLALWRYKTASLVTTPLEAVRSSVELEEISAEERVDMLAPSFWNETSLVTNNTGRSLAMRTYGYALSIPIPVGWDFATRSVVRPKGCTWYQPRRVWYDADMNWLGEGEQWWLKNVPKNAAYFRIYAANGGHNKDFSLIRDVKYDGKGSLRPSPRHPGELVLGERSDLRERYAVEAFNWVLRTVTGKVMPIVVHPTKRACPHVYVGRAFAEKKFHEEIVKLSGTDGFCIRRSGDDIYAFGADSRGTINALLELIRLNTDYFWFRPDEKIGCLFTPRDIVTFDKANVLSRPAFALRTWTGPGGSGHGFYGLWNGSGASYYVRPWNRFGTGYYRGRASGAYCEVSESFIEMAMGDDPDPSLQPMLNGERLPITNRTGQPCFSNPKTLEMTKRSVRRLVADAPEDWDYFGYDYSDSWSTCECPECLKPYRLPDGKLLSAKSASSIEDPLFRSTRTYIYGNAVAAEVNRLRPGTPVEMFAYIYTACPPSVRLDKNLKVLFATYDTASMRFPTLEQTWPAGYAPESWAVRFRKWLEENPTSMGMYEYFFTRAPGLYAEAAAANMQELAKAGAWHVHSQTQADTQNKSVVSEGVSADLWNINDAEMWVISRLMWDPFQDPKKLRNEYFDRVYGAGANEMKQLTALFEKRWFDRSCKTFLNCHTRSANAYVEFFVRPHIENQLFDLLAAALRKAPSESVRKHLKAKIDAFNRIKAEAAREDIPEIAPLKDEWNDFTSPQWNGAMKLTRFYGGEPDTGTNIARHLTQAWFGADKDWLYFRIEADSVAPADGDAVELRFLVNKQTRTFLLFGDGHREDMSNGDVTWECGWDAVMSKRAEAFRASGRIPMTVVRGASDSDLQMGVRRHAGDGELSIGYPALASKINPPMVNGLAVRTYGVDVVTDMSKGGDFGSTKGAQASRFANKPVIESFAVVPNQAYRLDFKARIFKLPVPHLPAIVSESRMRWHELFPHWIVSFEDARGKRISMLPMYNRTIFSRELKPRVDIFVAPAGAVRCVIQKPDATVAEMKDLALVHFDNERALNPDGRFVSGDTRVLFPFPFDGSGMCVWEGKPAFNTGYGAFTDYFPVKGGSHCRLVVERGTYGWYGGINMYFFDADGKRIGEVSARSLDYKFFVPKAAVRMNARVYNSYLTRFQIFQEGD